MDYQLGKLPSHITELLPTIQVTTYTLNRLKPFYACTERGFEEQLKRAQHELQGTIRTTVKAALQVVYENPLQHFNPLEQDSKEEALAELRNLLQDQSIQWQDLPQVLGGTLEEVLQSLAQGGLPNGTQGWQHQSQLHSPDNSGATPASSPGQQSPRWTYRPSSAAGPVTSDPGLPVIGEESIGEESGPGPTWQDYKRRRAAQKSNTKDPGKNNNIRRPY
ncbi:MAG: late competence development ComFB family protein [Prochlorothrix sp.]|nr:late competence development ComFB family protein [Prochlorothrix sp.]